MKSTLAIAALLATFSFCARAENQAKSDSPRDKALAMFDKDGDGKLNESERQALRDHWNRKDEGQHIGWLNDKEHKDHKDHQAHGDCACKRKHGEGELKERLLKEFDKDGDGKLNESEREEARKRREAHHAELLKRFDKDGDGKLSEGERPERKGQGQGHEQHAELLKRFDKNGDGKLDPKERELARKALERVKDCRCELIKRFDKNGDGKLSDDEKTAAKEHRQHKGQHGNNGLGNGEDGQPPGDPKVNDGEGTSPGNPGARPK